MSIRSVDYQHNCRSCRGAGVKIEDGNEVTCARCGGSGQTKYRIGEEVRDHGATIKPAAFDLNCNLCPRGIRAGVKFLGSPTTIPDTLCLRCAIRYGVLVEMEPVTTAAAAR